MALIITNKNNTAFRSEEVACVCHLLNEEINRLGNEVGIILKSGRDFTIYCKTVEEAKELKDKIIEILKQEY